MKLSEELAAPLRQLQEIAKRIAGVCREAKLFSNSASNTSSSGAGATTGGAAGMGINDGIIMDEKEYVQSFRVEMMDAVLQWCRGADFVQICKVRVFLTLFCFF